MQTSVSYGHAPARPAPTTEGYLKSGVPAVPSHGSTPLQIFPSSPTFHALIPKRIDGGVQASILLGHLLACDQRPIILGLRFISLHGHKRLQESPLYFRDMAAPVRQQEARAIFIA